MSWMVIAAALMSMVAVIITVVTAVINHQTAFANMARLDETNRRLGKVLKDLEDLERWVDEQ
jgi:type II secretory pathway component PulJ